MAKPITREMIEAMTLDQRKTLKTNAQNRDTQAAKDVLALLAEDDLMTRAATVASPQPTTPKSRKTRPVAKPEPVVVDDETEEELTD